MESALMRVTDTLMYRRELYSLDNIIFVRKDVLLDAPAMSHEAEDSMETVAPMDNAGCTTTAPKIWGRSADRILPTIKQFQNYVKKADRSSFLKFVMHDTESCFFVRGGEEQVCVKAFALHSFAFFYNILLYFIMMCIIIFKNNYM